MASRTKRNLACEPLFGSHSADTVAVFYGAENPAILCGRHALYVDSREWAIMRDEGTIPYSAEIAGE